MNRWDGVDEVVAVADTGSFAKAAQLLGVSTSHVSRAVARIEARLAVPIFARTTRIVSPTDAGRALIAQFRPLVTARDEVIATLDHGPEPQGHLRITCSVGLGLHFVTPILLDYMRAYPKVQVQYDLTDRLVDVVGEGYDVAIRTGNLPDSRLIRTQIARRTFVTCAAPAYVERRGAPVAIDELGQHDCVLGVGDHWHFRDQSGLRSIRPPSHWRFNNGSAVAQCAIAGFGICQLPEFYVHDAVASGALVPVLESYRAPPQPVWAVFPARRHMVTRVELLIERLRGQLAPRLSQDAIQHAAPNAAQDDGRTVSPFAA